MKMWGSKIWGKNWTSITTTISQEELADLMCRYNTGQALNRISKDTGWSESAILFYLEALENRGWYVHDSVAHKKMAVRRRWLEKQQPIIVG